MPSRRLYWWWREAAEGLRVVDVEYESRGRSKQELRFWRGEVSGMVGLRRAVMLMTQNGKEDQRLTYDELLQ